MLISQTFYRLTIASAALMVAATIAFGQATDKSAPRSIVLLAAIEGPIGPATARHVEKVIEEAAERQAEALILHLDTPGGLADAMRDIISEILSSATPVVGYVAPPGAHAASAGTYILYATHIAAMAPGTNLGAATPVPIGGLPFAPPLGGDKPRGSGSGDAADEEEAADGPPLSERIRSLAPDEAMNAKVTTTPSLSFAALPRCTGATRTGPRRRCARPPAYRRPRRLSRG